MNTTQIIALALIQHGPQLALAIYDLLHKTTEPTRADWEGLAAVWRKSYDDYVKPPTITTSTTGPQPT